MIRQAEQHSPGHLHHSKDDGNLHLEGVQECNLIGGQLPDLWNKIIKHGYQNIKRAMEDVITKKLKHENFKTP